jgi:hypothetical protein
MRPASTLAEDLERILREIMRIEDRRYETRESS